MLGTTKGPQGKHWDYNSKRLFVVSYQETDQKTTYCRIERTTYSGPYLTQKKKHECLYLCERLHDYMDLGERNCMRLIRVAISTRYVYDISLIKVKKEEAISANCFSFYFFFASFWGLILIGSRRKDSVQSNSLRFKFKGLFVAWETDSDLGQFFWLKECHFYHYNIHSILQCLLRNSTTDQNVAHSPHLGFLIIHSNCHRWTPLLPIGQSFYSNKFL